MYCKFRYLLLIISVLHASEVFACKHSLPSKKTDNFIKDGSCDFTPASTEEFSNAQARNIHRVGLVNERFGIDGKGVSIGIWDEGHVMAQHQEFLIKQPDGTIESKVVVGDLVSSFDGEHATHVGGTVAASGSVEPEAKGLAHSAKLKTFDFTNSLQSLKKESSAGLILSNHSYGLPVGWDGKANLPAHCNGHYWWGEDHEVRDKEFGAYSSQSFGLDNIIYQYPNMSAFFAAGNERSPKLNPYINGRSKVIHCVGDNKKSDTLRYPNGLNDQGYGTISHYAVSKNVITIGASRDQPRQLQATEFTSFGPTTDGRIKPDLVANGEWLLSTLPPFACNTNGTRICNYGSYSGSSMATPVATGIGALVNQQSKKTNSRYLSADQMKAVLVNTATSEFSDGSPTFRTGWGLINSFKAVNSIRNKNVESFTVKKPSVNKYFHKSFSWVKNSGTAYITIAWIDPPGKEVVNKARFYIRSPSKKLYYPWHLDASKPTERARKCAYDNAPVGFSQNCVRSSWDNVLKISIPPSDWENGKWSLIGDMSLLDKSLQKFSFSISNSINFLK